jgi:hypothetical protein
MGRRAAVEAVAAAKVLPYDLIVDTIVPANIERFCCEHVVIDGSGA